MNRKLHLSLVLFYCIIIAIQAVKGDFWRVLLLLFLVYIATGGWDFVKICLITLPRDARYDNYLLFNRVDSGSFEISIQELIITNVLP